MIRTAILDWTRDKTKGAGAFTYTSIASASLLRTDARIDGTARATLTPDQAEAHAYCTTALQAWHVVALAAQKLTLIKTCVEIIDVPIENKFKKSQQKNLARHHRRCERRTILSPLLRRRQKRLRRL
jgi:hypothetical protein